MTDSQSTPSAENIRAWLVAEVSKRKIIPIETIDTTVPFANYELDSMEAVNLAGELEDWLGVELEPTLVWDYPTIDKLARHLANLVGS